MHTFFLVFFFFFFFFRCVFCFLFCFVLVRDLAAKATGRSASGCFCRRTALGLGCLRQHSLLWPFRDRSTPELGRMLTFSSLRPWHWSVMVPMSILCPPPATCPQVLHVSAKEVDHSKKTTEFSHARWVWHAEDCLSLLEDRFHLHLC